MLVCEFFEGKGCFPDRTCFKFSLAFFFLPSRIFCLKSDWYTFFVAEGFRISDVREVIGIWKGFLNNKGLKLAYFGEEYEIMKCY